MEGITSTKTLIWVVVAIPLGFLVASGPKRTGITVHEWLGLALAKVMIIHVALHWERVLWVAIQFVRRLFHASMLNVVVGILLFLAFALVILSGLPISRGIPIALGLEVAASPTGRFLHFLVDPREPGPDRPAPFPARGGDRRRRRPSSWSRHAGGYRSKRCSVPGPR